MAPNVVGKSLGGDYLALADHRGEVVLVNVWATWCGPCRSELPALARLHRAHLNDGFSVFAVSVDKHGAEGKVRGMAQEFALPFPIVLDPDRRWIEALEASSLPTSVLVGRSGAVLWRRQGAIRADDPELQRTLITALAAPAP
jgi:thiol-disulfide isomerase/thioredoxin